MQKTGIIHGDVLTPTGIIKDGAIYIKDNRIDAIGETKAVQIPGEARVLHAGGYLVAPGFIDAHIHGGNGFDFMSDKPGDIDAILDWLASTGVTGVYPTIATTPLEEQLGAIKLLTEARKRKVAGAAILGLHLEGPYISREKRGAQQEEAIRLPNQDEMAQLIEAGEGTIKIVTLAPELPGAIELIQYLVDQNVIVSIGHTAASYEQIMQAIDVGARRASHLFNGMTAFHHRRPGAVGAILTRDEVCAEVILDGVHLHPATVEIVLRSKGLSKVSLVTDAIAAAGGGDGAFIGLGNQKINVKNGVATLEGGNLAGSTLKMNQAVKNAVELLGLTLDQAMRLASQVVAESLGYEVQATKGVISPGKDADLIILDHNLNIFLTMVGGNVVFQDPGQTSFGTVTNI
jgi:N-acetylglucosamine-6-phosphate deacetylase